VGAEEVFMVNTNVTRRIAISLPEARLEHGLSQRQLAALSGVSVATVGRAERGGRVGPALLVRLAAAVLVLDVYRPPYFDDDVDVMLSEAAQRGEWAT
jgi:transcriptional regulator with XRE-family HTH domain